MEAAVQGIVVFGLALRAHPKVTHGGVRPVIRHAFDYGKAWATVGAVDERIAVAAVLGVQQLGKTSWAGSNIGRDKLVFPSLCLTLPDLEVLVTDRGAILDGYVFDVS
jgi:hypothetical protein